ncbi:DegT/DnrJ/EryC1/StrS family aminotransferase [Candidatus Micrarchaeota archaeon]|nr:DegT/DnrJ/EryC1/StrS family aminotransferase [Candidatus Micrarchaeota archaeon]
MEEKPAILGGKPIFEEQIPIIRPTIKDYATEQFMEKIRKILESNRVTNSENVKMLEAKIAEYSGVKEAVCVSSCTSGLVLAIQALGLQGKEVLVPSFTFHSTAHACKWNNCKIKFIECNEKTFNVSIGDLEEKITRETAGIIGVHVFGNPCETKKIQEIADARGIKIVYDSAHGLGATQSGKKVGSFGTCEVFSASPTKLLVTMEGGIVTTNDSELAKKLRIARNYGDSGNYDCEFAGLNARMEEINATLGIEMLSKINEYVANRNEYANKYTARLEKIPGITFQEITHDSTSTYKDFAILINEEKFGVGRNEVYEALKKENIASKKYFHPPVHQQKAYRTGETMLNTEKISNSVLCVPIYSKMTDETINGVCKAVAQIQNYAEEIKKNSKVMNWKLR